MNGACEASQASTGKAYNCAQFQISLERLKKSMRELELVQIKSPD